MDNNSVLLINGKIFQCSSQTSQKDATFFSCMLIRGGTIQHVGTEDDEPIVTAKATSIPIQDLKEQTVLPGFIDGHIHLLILGQSLQKVGLEHCKDLEDIRSAIKAYVAANPSLPRIFCRGWMHSMNPSGVNTSMLDDLDPRPIFIDSKDLHSTWCNTAAIQDLGVTSDTQDPPGGKIHRDPTTGKATGLLSEAAVFTIVWPHIATVASISERAAAIRAAIDVYNSAGYTGLIDMAMDENAWEALLHLRQQTQTQTQGQETGRLPMRIAAYWLIKPSETAAGNLAQVDRAIELSREYNEETTLDCRLVGIKVICDGIIDACTAALTEPYSTGTDSGPIWRAEELHPIVRKADAAGLQVALHAIGDRTIKMALDVLEQCASPTRRPRIEHLELASAADAKRLGKLGVTASIQPVHSDPAILRAWPRLLGAHRCGRAFAYREFADGGAPLALGSDAPTAPHAPLANVYVATTRRSAREPGMDTSGSVVNGQFRLGLCEAVAAATEGAAYSCFGDGTSGRLEKGLRADFVVVDVEWDAERLLQANVKETWFEGRRVYSASA